MNIAFDRLERALGVQSVHLPNARSHGGTPCLELVQWIWMSGSNANSVKCQPVLLHPKNRASSLLERNAYQHFDMQGLPWLIRRDFQSVCFLLPQTVTLIPCQQPIAMSQWPQITEAVFYWAEASTPKIPSAEWCCNRHWRLQIYHQISKCFRFY